MKHLVVIVRPFRAQEVVEVLQRLGGEGLCATEVKGFGRQKEHLDDYVTTEFALTFLPKIKIEAWLPAGKVDEAIAAVTAAARTGRIGDGKMFLLDAVDVPSA